MNEIDERVSHALQAAEAGKRSYALSKLTGEVVDCSQVLEVLSTSTEDEFLSIGSKLGDFRDRAQFIAETASSIANLIAGDKISASINRLNSFVEEVADYLERSESYIEVGVTRLEQVMSLIEESQTPLQEFSSVIRNLRSLGIASIIQNAVLRRPEEGFHVLGADVKRLSAVIADKSLVIERDMNALSDIITRSLLRLRSRATVLKVNVADICSRTTSSANFLAEKYSVAADLAERISRSSEDISLRISTIVTSLQFHDIARQRFEGYKRSFEKMFGDVRGISDDSASVKKASKGESRAVLKSLLAFCSGQKAPLRQTRDEFTRALVRIRESLDAIADEVNEMLKNTDRMARPMGTSTNLFITDLEHSLAAVLDTISALSESAAAKGELAEAVDTVLSGARDMAGFIKEIEEIGDDIELLALNAALKADHIGEEGKALSVIAQSIQRISSETQGYTSKISAMLKGIASSVDELTHLLETGTQQETIREEDLTRDLKGMVASFHAINKSAASSLNEIEESGRRLAEDIKEVVGKSAIDQSVDEVVGEVLENLERISAEVRRELRTREFLEDDAEAEIIPSVPELETDFDHGMQEDRSSLGPGDNDNVELF